MSKKETWNNVKVAVQDLLETQPKLSNKFKDSLWDILTSNLEPKGSTSLYPPKLDDEGNIVESWCRFHKRYEVIEDMVISKGKPKGYCRASISKWNKTNSNIKKLDSEAVEAMSEGNFEEAQEIALKSKELKGLLNSPDYYDYDEDWANFNNKDD